jgi:CRP/FNR family transcriptional regulator, cyclic AMP receptor protein
LCLTEAVWPLLDTMGVKEREAFLALTTPRTFARNEIVCHAGDPADSLHLVESGHLAVRGGLATGVTATFTILSGGDYFGELALLRADHRRTATVVALEPSRTLSVAATAFHALCRENPRVERALSAMLADRVDALSRRLLETMYESLDRRVYRRLVELAQSYGVREGRATIPLSQTQLADLVGATRPSVNQVLQRLAGQGVVRLGRGQVEVLDVVVLARRCRP